MPLHFEAPEVRLKLDRAAVDEAYAAITDNLSEQDRDDLAKRAAKMAVLVKNPERVRAVVQHLVNHFKTKVEPNDFKAQVVVFDRECCVLYKAVMDDPKFTALGERLEKVKERHEQGFLTSLEFLKQILELAREVVETEKQTDPVEERDRAKEALTELFNEARNGNTHIIVERIVNDIDEIVRKVRFPDWQSTSQGERLVQKELRKTLLKYQLHRDQDLFDRAFSYIRQYY